MHIFTQEMLDFANLLHALQMVEQESKPTTNQQAIYQETRKALRPDGNNTSFLPLIIIIIIIIIIIFLFFFFFCPTSNLSDCDTVYLTLG